MTREEYTEYIKMIFNYYNGKINVINNSAYLDINWLEQPRCHAGGWSHTPDIVKINPAIIIAFNENDWDVIKVCTLEVIIHELFHTDQLIHYNHMSVDLKYLNDPSRMVYCSTRSLGMTGYLRLHGRKMIMMMKH